MINNIEIIIINGPIEIINLLILFNENICISKGKKYKIDEEFKHQIVDIIHTWKNEYGTSKNIDAQEFNIIVRTNEEERFHGKGIYPSNYEALLELLEQFL